MLIDWEAAAPEASFEIQVRDVRRASAFYRDVLGAREMYRSVTDDGVTLRAGLAAGAIQFVLSSQAAPEPASLSRLANELGVPYLAVILPVDDPNDIAASAMRNGAALKERPDSDDLVVVTDPFGSHWAFVKREAAGVPPADPSRQPRRGSSRLN